jgi:hypothetical protein
MPGAFMTFMGGEEQIETELRRAHELRRALPELGAGTCEYLPEAASSDDVLVALRRLDDHASLVVINLSSEAVRCDIAVEGLDGAGALDLWSDVRVAAADGGSVRLDLGGYQPRVLRLT